MNRQTRMLVVLGVAIVVAALATYGVIIAIRTRPAPPADPTIEVVVAAKPIETGACLTKDQVKLMIWPAKFRPANALAKTEDAIGRSLITAGVENEPITQSKLATRDAGCGLPPTIVSGMRAMSVKVNEVIGVAGFVTPGTRVDVLVTMQESSDTISRVVVRNVQVLTAGTKIDEANAKAQNKPIPSTVVTLMVTPPDAERIALAATRGQIMLALRNPLDREVVPTTGVSIAELMGRPPRATASAAPPPASRPVLRPTTPAPVEASAPPPRPRGYMNCVAGKCTVEQS